MADVTPAGPVAVAVDGLRTLIANIPFFKTWTLSDDATAALASIFVGEMGFPAVSIVIASDVATVETREPHTFQIGDVVTLSGGSIGPQSVLGVDGTQTVLGITETTFTFSTAALALPDQGPLYPDEFLVQPAERPIAVISDEDDPVRSESIGTGGAAIFSGSLDIVLEADVSKEYQDDSRNALYEARNAFGNFIQGLATTQGTGDLMCLNRIETAASPVFTAKSEQDDGSIRFERWRAMVRVTWGLEG